MAGVGVGVGWEEVWRRGFSSWKLFSRRKVGGEHQVSQALKVLCGKVKQ